MNQMFPVKRLSSTKNEFRCFPIMSVSNGKLRMFVPRIIKHYIHKQQICSHGSPPHRGAVRHTRDACRME